MYEPLTASRIFEYLVEVNAECEVIMNYDYLCANIMHKKLEIRL